MTEETNPFFSHPILNSPYQLPGKHWELDKDGQPTQKVLEKRRPASFITPIPKPKKQKGKPVQDALPMDEGLGLSTKEQAYSTTSNINAVRQLVAQWRSIPDSARWGVTPETARLLTYWRTHEFSNQRPFFCQVEAVETAIWLHEVAPNTAEGRKMLAYLDSANFEANPDLMRLALKLATGAGKTTVMAMLIAWQTVNAVRHPQSRRFTRGFLIVAPGLTIKDRLRVLQPNDPYSYYESRELVPDDLLPDLARAKIVITNYHAFRLRERLDISKGSRAFLQGRGEALSTLETEGQMLQRVMSGLMGLKNIMVLNDEAHHCYREKPGSDLEGDLIGEAKKEAQQNNEAARLWITGLETVNRKLGVLRVMDLSATPFFLRGSGYAEGTLFPWTMSDFSLMDAIECGIVKLPRVPVAQNITGGEMPMFRDLWENIRKDMPKKGRGAAGTLDPLALPTRLQTALEALYGHYEKTYALWAANPDVSVPPCFIVVCNNTSTSKLVYDYISGFTRTDDSGQVTHVPGRLALFRNHDELGNSSPQLRTLLIDSEQLESGEALDASFREAASEEIEKFRRDMQDRSGNAQDVAKITDQELLREVMNTVGRAGSLGASIRCVVSVSMLTEGWDANNVTHVLGVRAFGTQLLCEQVIGRALRRQSYELNEEGLFNTEYADVLGIPFDFTAKPVIAPPQPPRQTIQVKAVRPERDAQEIRFPRVEGYRIELPKEKLSAGFTADSHLTLSPQLVGPTITQNAGIIGEAVDLDVKHLKDERLASVAYRLTQRLLNTKWREPGEPPKLHLFGQLKRIVTEWLTTYLECTGSTYPAQLLYQQLSDMACERIHAAIVASHEGQSPVVAILDAYNPIGSTMHVNFNTSKTDRWQTDPRKCHINWAILDSEWEGEFCRVAEAHPRVVRYVKNQNLGFEVPYRFGSVSRRYLPDFIVQVDDGRGPDDLLNLVVEIKGYRGEDAKDKKLTMDTYWVPGVNQLGSQGRWAFAELRDLNMMDRDFSTVLGEQMDNAFERLILEHTPTLPHTPTSTPSEAPRA